jgi:hypothetical protein
MKKFYFLGLFSVLIIFSCKTANKSYQKGDYTEAIELGIKKLQKDPYDNQTKELVKNAYNYAVNQHEDAIRSLSNRKGDERYEAIYHEYVQLQNLYNIINRYPATAKLVDARNYSEYLQTYGDKAADYHIANAEKWEEEGTKQAAREAYKEYRSALHFRPNDFDLKKKRDEAYDAAITKVLVVPIQAGYGGNYGYPNDSRYRNSYQLQNFQNEVMRTLSYNMGNDFVRFYSEWDLRNKNMEPDQVMELNIGRIIIGRPFDNTTSREVSKIVVVKETVYKPDSVVKEYATVRGRITQTRRTLLSEGDLYITVRDTKGRTLWNDRFTGQHQWHTEFATYTGDERALSEGDKSLLTNRNTYPPSEDQVMDDLFRQINSELSYRLRNYFARF